LLILKLIYNLFERWQHNLMLELSIPKYSKFNWNECWPESGVFFGYILCTAASFNVSR